MRRAQIWEHLQDVGVRLEARGRALIFRQEGETIVDHVVSEDPAVWIFGGFRRVKTQHVGKRALLVDRGNRFLARVIAGMPHEVNELLEPPIAVVGRLARVVFLFGVIGVEEAADAWMTRAIDVKQLAVASQAASPPDVDLGLGIKFARRQLNRGRSKSNSPRSPR